MSIRQLIAIGSLGLMGVALAQTAPPPAQVLRLPEVLQAVRGNLDVRLAQDAAAAARADVTAADHAPLPVLTAKASQMDLQNGLGGGSWLTRKRVDKSLGIDWTWERGGKRASRTLAAQRAADAAEADLSDTRLQQQLAGLQGYYDLLAAQERLDEVNAIRQAAVQLASTAAQRVRAGDLAAQEAARTEIEAQRAQADAQAALLDRQQAASLLAQLTGRPETSASLQVAPAWPALQAPDLTGDLTQLVEQRADVQAALARVQSAEAALANAEALRKNDITWGASMDHYPGTSTRLLELRMQMPLQMGYSFQGEIARAQAALNQARNALDRTRLVALTETQRLQNELATALDRARRYENDILPRARQVAQAAELAWTKGALALIELLDARRTLRATQLDAINARADFARARGSWLLRTRPDDLLTAP